MNVLVTGGCGFVGSALVHHLRAARPEWRVVTFDLLTYAANADSLAALEGDPKHRLVRGDVCDEPALQALLREEEIDAIFNLAAETHVDRSLMDARAFVRTNVLGAQAVLDAAQEAGVRRVVHVSTDEVYGAARPGTRFREGDALHPTSPYAASKAGGDLLALAAHRTRAQDVIVTRCTNNYGPRQFPEKLVPLMVVRALAGEPLPIYGDGLQRRDWLHVDEHAEGLVLALEKGRPGAVYHFAADEERANLDVVKAILRAVDRPESLIRHVADRPGHDRRYALDWTRSREELGWRPRRRFDEGLAETVRWYADHRGWWERVMTGAYRDYVERQYGTRLRGGG